MIAPTEPWGETEVNEVFDDRRYCRPLRVAQGRPRLSSTIWQIDRRNEKGPASAGRPPRALAGDRRVNAGKAWLEGLRSALPHHTPGDAQPRPECPRACHRALPGARPGTAPGFPPTERALSLSSDQGDTNVPSLWVRAPAGPRTCACGRPARGQARGSAYRQLPIYGSGRSAVSRSCVLAVSPEKRVKRRIALRCLIGHIGANGCNRSH